jgi:ring-1,2-phenylacetyl-CoA epoxidase subunit PaaE
MSFYLNFRITDIDRSTSKAAKVTFVETDQREISFYPGQFITFLFDIEGETVRRSYSICTAPSELPNIGIAIKEMDDGVVSKYLVQNLKEGDVVKAFPPMGNFTIYPGKLNERKMIMFAGGSGITPLFSMIKSVLEKEKNSNIDLYYANRFEEQIIFKEELEQLEKNYSNLNVVHTLTRPSEDWEGETGRIDKEKVKQFLESYSDDYLKEADFYLCGPEGMMEEVKTALADLQINEDKIHQESFTTAVIDEDEEIEEKPRDVTVIFEGKKHVITVQPEDSILETALEEGIELPHSCQMGQCSTCMAKLISGQLKLVEQTALDEEDFEQGYCLTCVGYPASDDVVVLYDDE